MRQSALWPRLDRQKKTFLVELAELLGLRTETRPDRYHEMCVLGVYILYHLRSFDKFL